jgi:hypothetical protein
MSENLKNDGVKKYLQEYEKFVNTGVRKNFSKETYNDLLDQKDSEITALRTELAIVKRNHEVTLDELEWWNNYGEHVSKNRSNADHYACQYADKIQEDNA